MLELYGRLDCRRDQMSECCSIIAAILAPIVGVLAVYGIGYGICMNSAVSSVEVCAFGVLAATSFFVTCGTFTGFMMYKCITNLRVVGE